MELGSKENLVRVDISDAGNDLLMHQQRLKAPSPASEDPHKFIRRDPQWITAESASNVLFETRLIQQREPPESARIPVLQFRLPSPCERQFHMHMLRVFGVHGAKEEKPCHAKLSDDVTMILLFFKPEHDALAVSLNLP
jgi:hypothetical protein